MSGLRLQRKAEAAFAVTHLDFDLGVNFTGTTLRAGRRSDSSPAFLREAMSHAAGNAFPGKEELLSSSGPGRAFPAIRRTPRQRTAFLRPFAVGMAHSKDLPKRKFLLTPCGEKLTITQVKSNEGVSTDMFSGRERGSLAESPLRFRDIPRFAPELSA